tara:strand:+ start:199 stop:1113 length:915 start_codon:yes stop_codon:yes gene_type:complete
MIYVFLLLLSFVMIWKSADFFVESSHSIAIKLNVSPIIIGATVVAFGTSAPELFVNIFAALDQDAGIIYGNILGSNLANTLLILGVGSLLTPILIQRSSLSHIISNFLFTIFVAIFLINGWVTRISGAFIFMVFLIYYIFIINRSEPSTDQDHSNGRSLLMLGFIFLLSLIGLVFSAKLLVFSLLKSATFLGLSTVFLSLFIVAFGTSLPELVSTIIFLRKGYTDMLIGNVFGSNLFNLMFVLPITWFVLPLEMPTLLQFELTLLLTLLSCLLILGISFKKFNSYVGSSLLLIYFIYIGFIYFR